MDARDDRYSAPPDGPSFQLHALPLHLAGSGPEDASLQNSGGYPNRASRDFQFNSPKDASPTSSTEQFPEFEDSPYGFPTPTPTPTPRWRRLSIARPRFYVWARRLRIGAEKVADGSLFGMPQAGRKRRSLHCVLVLLALALMIL